MPEALTKIGETVYILGSGPSLDGFDYNLLNGKFVIAINDAGILQYPPATILLSTDERWCASAWVKAKLFKGKKIICSEPVPLWPKNDKRLSYIRRERRYGLSANPDIIYGIHTGAQAAINYAAHLNPPQIVLLGVDLAPDGGRKYTYGGATSPRTARQFMNMRRALESTAAPLRKKNIDVINASHRSIIECWARCRPEAAFQGLFAR